MIPGLLLLLAGGCAPDPAPPLAAPPAPLPLEAPRLLRRLSLDLRGVVPSVEELDAVEAEPSRVDAYRDAWLAAPTLEQRLVELLAEPWRTRIDEFDARWYDFGLAESDDFTLDQAVGEEPLRLMAWIATQNRPWSETVTADYTRATPLLASIWPLEYPAGATGWQVARWTDGRPAAGVLATNGLWWRYGTNPFNQGRSRAGAILRHLLCEDFLTRPVSFSAAESAAASGNSDEAVRSEPYCLACHAVVDPLAAATFGFWWRTQYSAVEMVRYHAEREPLGESRLGVAPAWFGEPLTGLGDLAQQVAVDPRFHRCAVQTAGSMLLRRPIDDIADHDAVSRWLLAYQAGGESYLEALRAITDDPLYRAGRIPEGGDASRASTMRMQSTDQLASSLEALTGFRWRYGGADMLGLDTVGYRLLAGGVDGMTVVQPPQDPSVTWALAIERLAQAASYAAVQQDFGGEPPPVLLTGVTRDTVPGDLAFEAQLRELHWRLYAVRADDAFLEEATALWSESLASEGDPRAAWMVLLSAMLRDPLWVGT